MKIRPSMNSERTLLIRESEKQEWFEKGFFPVLASR
jgi:hypothetical protein